LNTPIRIFNEEHIAPLGEKLWKNDCVHAADQHGQQFSEFVKLFFFFSSLHLENEN